MYPDEENNKVPKFVKEDFSPTKFDKNNELNETMTISPSAPDELENKLKGGFA